MSKLFKDHFNDYVVVITGAAKGIGLEVASAFNQQGAKVIMADLNLDEVSEAAKGVSDSAMSIELDVTSESAWLTTIEKINQHYGRLDGLINNAGVGSMGDLEKLSLEQWSQTLSVNVTGAFLGCKHSLCLLKKSPAASIINISSVHGSRANPASIDYSASKAAISSLNKSIALYCANKKYPVRCNAIQPGYIRTPMLEAGLANAPNPDELLGQLEQMHPLGHLGDMNDIAQAAVFLASDKAKFITGASLAVDGGFLCR